MKTTLFLLKTYILMAVSVLAVVACDSDNQEARTPVARMQTDKRQLEVNESMTLHFTGVADQVVVYTGDKDHDYELREENNTGFVVNKGLMTYSYSVPGTFRVVCVATTYDSYLGGSQKQDTLSFDVVVTDRVTAIDAIYATVTPNVYLATPIGNNNWLMCLPQKQMYNGREMAVKAERQRLTIEAGSDSAKVFIDGEPYSSKNYYALNTDHQIRVVSGSGLSADYRLVCMVYPEFLTLTVDGEEPVLTRSPYYQDLLTYSVGGSVLDFTLEPGVRLLADGEEVASGSAIRQEAHYTLVRSHADIPEAVAVSRVVFEKK